MTSREEFEEWWESWSVQNEDRLINLDFEYQLWQAGRQSMKDEAIKLLSAYFDNEYAVKAIKEIQP